MAIVIVIAIILGFGLGMSGLGFFDVRDVECGAVGSWF